MKYARVGGGLCAASPLPAILALCLLLTGCSGLPTAREMGDMALLRTLGVDPSPAGVSVTGSTGPRAKGLQGDREPALTLSADRESLSGACLAMQGQSDSFVFFGYVDQLLVGEELAKEGVRPVLDYFSRDAELGWFRGPPPGMPCPPAGTRGWTPGWRPFKMTAKWALPTSLEPPERCTPICWSWAPPMSPPSPPPGREGPSWRNRAMAC